MRYNQKEAILVKGVSDPGLIKAIGEIALVQVIDAGLIVFAGRGSAFQRLLSLLSQYDLNIKNAQRKVRKEKALNNWRSFIDSRKENQAFADIIKEGILKKQPFERPPEESFLMNHQRAGVLLAERFNHYAFFYDTGTGKTILALQIIYNKIRENGAVFLVICPKSIIQTAWMDDCQNHFPRLKLLPLTGGYSPEDYQKWHFRWAKANGTSISVPGYQMLKKGTKKERTLFAKSYMAAEADCYIVNPEMFLRSPDEFLHIKTLQGVKDVNGIIVDESARLKNQSNVLTRKLKELRPQMDFLYLLSGKPAPNDISEYIPQVEIIEPKILRPGLKTDIYTNGGSSSSKELTKYINMVSVTVSKKDCFDLPETTEVVREVDLTDEAKKQYLSMKYQMKIELDALPEKDRLEKTRIYVDHVLACLTKLRQISGGFIYDGEKPVAIHDGKALEVVELLEELGDEPVLIWCQYQYEIEHLRAVLQDNGYQVGTAYGKTKDLNANIYAFKENRIQILIANPRTLQYGVTLTNCCYAIYYSTSYSYEEYYQSHDRIYRKGQSRPCTYIFLQCKDTIDKIMFEVIQRKQSQTEMIEQTIKHIYQS